ncbi:MAG: cytochrome c, rane-bound [Caulobacteraceae bacterium]|nr:cytochrome c, rane-bound [Caulobacteraceae bacterium]
MQTRAAARWKLAAQVASRSYRVAVCGAGESMTSSRVYVALHAGRFLAAALVAVSIAGFAAASAQTAAAPAAAMDLPDWGTVLPKADLKAGALAAYACQNCHSIASGGASVTAPRLYGVVGRETATDFAFQYSPALIDFAAKNPVWTYDQLYTWLAGPRDLVPGTRMSFRGLPDAETRINVIAYLRTLGPAAPIPAPDPRRQATSKPATGN